MPLSSSRLGWCRGLPIPTLLVAVSLAHAQGAPGGTGRADPLDAEAPVPAVTYASPLADYRRLGEDTRIPWREANETVHRIGGWKAYAREAQQPEPAASAPAGRAAPTQTPTPTPAQGGHGTH
jgi:hypothetical protein